MTRLALGVLLWSVVHLFTALTVDLRKSLINRIGEYPYKGVFTLLVIFSIYLIATGWGLSTSDNVFYTAPEWSGHVTSLLVFAGFILFFAPYPPNNIKRMLRHPQLIGTICWSAGHLLATGSLRSVILFGGFAVWALFETVLIGRRDGDWIKPEKVSHLKDVSLVLFGSLAFFVFLFTHHLMFGGDPLT
jgi:uncharacterized membrane protein